MAGKTVVVTGANGYVASWIVKLLLERGYSVRGTVRNPDNLEAVQHLLDLPGASEGLTLHKADLLGEAGYDEVMDGAHYVIHTAAPVIVDISDFDPWRDVVNPCVDGTLIVLRAAARAKTVRRVLHTSSIAAIFFSERFENRQKGEVVDESWWSDEVVAGEQTTWYCLGKLRSERAAFDFTKNTPGSFDLVSLNPALCYGTSLSKNKRLSFGHWEMKRLIVGDEWKSDAWSHLRHTCAVAVQDVAEAHLLVLENPRAHGRYMLCERSLNQAQTAYVISQMFPQYPSRVDLAGMDEATFLAPLVLAPCDRIRELGLEFTPASVYLRETVEDLVAQGGVEP